LRIRVSTWRHVLVFSSLITALAVAVPVVIVSLALLPVPLHFKLPVLIISGLIPLFIAFPISIFALHMLRMVHETVSTLDRLVKFDALTGLLSRARFLQLVEERRQAGGVLALLDADHFKRINDSYGHAAGDDALQHISAVLMQGVGTHGFVGRMGGEEFAIYYPASTLSQAKLSVASIGTVLRSQAFVHQGIEIIVTLSAGLAQDAGKEPIAIPLRRADKLLYLAKKRGRDRYEVEEALDEKAHSAA
jgi:diguanylate cyclase (GGDEF)-like protein